MQYEARLESSEMWVVVSEDGSQRIPFGRGHARRGRPGGRCSCAKGGSWCRQSFAS